MCLTLIKVKLTVSNIQKTVFKFGLCLCLANNTRLKTVRKGLYNIVQIVGAFCLKAMLLDPFRSSGGTFILHVVAFITPVRRAVSLKAPPDSIT